MKKITIIETDSHGRGLIYTNDGVSSYAYDDCGWGDVAAVFRTLLADDTVSKNEVKIYTLEEAIEKLHNMEEN